MLKLLLQVASNTPSITCITPSSLRLSNNLHNLSTFQTQKSNIQLAAFHAHNHTLNTYFATGSET